MCTSMIKGSMLSLLERTVQAKIEKMDCFVENGIFSISDRTEQALSPPICRITKDRSSVELLCKTSAEGENSKRDHVLNCWL